MKNKIKYESKRRTPWDESIDLTPLQSFIREKYINDFYFKHMPLTETTDSNLLNSYSMDRCKHCGSKKIKKNGYYKNKIRKYYCNDCNKNFNILTNTIFQDHKLPLSEWIAFCLELFGHTSYKLISKIEKKSVTTVKYWTDKLFLLLEDYQDNIILDNTIYLDETYYPIAKKDIELNEYGLKKRGLSIDKICIAVATDGRKTIALTMGFGKPSSKKAIQTYGKHIKEESLIHHDMEKSHNILIDMLSLKSIRYNSKDIARIQKDKDNPLNPINKIHNILKQFLNSHSGFNRDQIKDYLNLFCFISNTPKDPLKKVEILLICALGSAKNLKYRDFSKKNGLTT